jgi:hypothetical protein
MRSFTAFRMTGFGATGRRQSLDTTHSSLSTINFPFAVPVFLGLVRGFSPSG